MLKNILLLVGFSTFVVVVLIGFDIYLKSQHSTVPPSTKQNMDPIPSSFDTKTLEKLKERQSIPIDLSQRSTVVSEDSRSTVTTPVATPTQTATISAPPDLFQL